MPVFTTAMCQLLGLNCATPTDARFSFAGLAPRGGITADHTDGFGLGYFEGRTCRVVHDERSASTSPLAQRLQQVPFPSINTIAHLRKATHGAVGLANCHPFVRELWGRSWLFAHNGHLEGYDPMLDRAWAPHGTTDSERAFCALLQGLHAQFGDQEPPLAQWVGALRTGIAAIAAHGTFNLLLSNGDAMLAHCSTHLFHLTRAWPFAHAHLIDVPLSIDFAQHTQPEDRVVVVATHPLTHNESWTACAPGEMLVWRGAHLLDRQSTLSPLSPLHPQAPAAA